MICQSVDPSISVRYSGRHRKAFVPESDTVGFTLKLFVRRAPNTSKRHFQAYTSGLPSSVPSGAMSPAV